MLMIIVFVPSESWFPALSCLTTSSKLNNLSKRDLMSSTLFSDGAGIWTTVESDVEAGGCEVSLQTMRWVHKAL